MLHIPCLLKIVVFWPFKTLLYPLGKGEKDFFFILKRYDLANVRNECVRFGGYVHIEVSYKILQLEILNKAPILLNSPCF
jgi:hypothetical protein